MVQSYLCLYKGHQLWAQILLLQEANILFMGGRLLPWGGGGILKNVQDVLSPLGLGLKRMNESESSVKWWRWMPDKIIKGQ